MEDREIQSHGTVKRRRRDHRQEGTLAHYVVFLLPDNKPWTSTVRGEFRQIHQCGRDQGHYYQTDGTGHLREDPALFDQLNGTDARLFERALSYLGQRWPRMGKAIEIYQKIGKREIATFEDAALRYQISQERLCRNFWDGIDMLRSLMRGEGVRIREDYRKEA